MIGMALLLAILSVPHGPAVSLTLTPVAFGMAGHPLCVQVRTPPHVDNRILATTIDCDNYFRSWQEQLDGANAIAVRRHCFEPMPPGQCVVGADLFRVDPTAKSGVRHFADRKNVCFTGGDVQC